MIKDLISRFRSAAFTATALVAVGFVIAGCSNGPVPNEKVEAQRVDKAKAYRAYFDKAHGDYNALEPGDKADFIKFAGSEENAQKFWNMMKYGPGGSPPPGKGQAPSATPGGAPAPTSLPGGGDQ